MEKLIYISQGQQPMDHLQNIKRACKAGVRWVQLRLKNCSEVDIEEIAAEALYTCQEYNAKLSINDHPEIAHKVGAHGVHLGKEDGSIDEARRLLGNDAIVGGTANSVNDILSLTKSGADYIGLGPFRFTKTKSNLSPILGIEGYTRIMAELKKRNVDMPVYAVGGITADDAQGLLNTGVYGLAVASFITKAADQTTAVKSLHQALYQTQD